MTLLTWPRLFCDLYTQSILTKADSDLDNVADSDPHHFGKLDQSEKQDQGPHQSEKVGALEGHFGALEGPNLGKREWQDPDPDKIERQDLNPDPQQRERQDPNPDPQREKQDPDPQHCT